MASTDETSGVTSSRGTPSSFCDSDNKSEAVEDDESRRLEHDKNYKCQICGEAYCDPRLLSCLHTYCLTCMDTMVRKGASDEKKVVCCFCQTVTPLPNNSTQKDLMPNKILADRVAALTFNSEDNNLHCRSCKDKKPAVARCFDCPLWLCEACRASHELLRKYDDCTVVSLDTTRLPPIAKKEVCKGRSYGSHEQQNPQDPSVFCYSCNAPLCEQCAETEHCGHMIQGISRIPNVISGRKFSAVQDQKQASIVDNIIASLDKDASQSFKEAFEKYREFTTVSMNLINSRFLNTEKEMQKKFNNVKQEIKKYKKAHAKYTIDLTQLVKFLDGYENANPWEVAEIEELVEQRFCAINHSNPSFETPLRSLETHFEFFGCTKRQLYPLLPQLASVVVGKNPEIPHIINPPAPPQPIARPVTSRPGPPNVNLQTQGSFGHRGNNVTENDKRQGKMQENPAQSNGYGSDYENGAVNRIVPNGSYHMLNPSSASTFQQSSYTSKIFSRLADPHGGSMADSPSSQMSISQPNSANVPNTSSICFDSRAPQQTIVRPVASRPEPRNDNSRNQESFGHCGISKGCVAPNRNVPNRSHYMLNLSSTSTFQQSSYTSQSFSGLADHHGGNMAGIPSSQMSISQPSSANVSNTSNTSFDFSNLTMDDHNRVWPSLAAEQFPWSVGNAQYQNQSLQFQQLQKSQGQNQPDDVFSELGIFEARTTQNSNSRPSLTRSVRRMQVNYFLRFGEYGTENHQITEPRGICFDRYGRLVLTDTNNHRLKFYNMKGEYLTSSLGFDSSRGRLNFPNCIAISPRSGKVVLTERHPNQKIKVLTEHGKFITAFGENKLQSPRGIAVDTDENIIVIESKVMRVSIFSIQGHFLTTWTSTELEFPNSVAVNDAKEIFISDNRFHCVKVFNYAGDFLRIIGGEGLTSFPIAVCIDMEGEVVVFDNHNNFNITVFSQDGTFKRAYESRGRHTQCFDVCVTSDGAAVVTSKDCEVYAYPYKNTCTYIQGCVEAYMYGRTPTRKNHHTSTCFY